MKVIRINRTDNKYHVTTKPSLMGRLFGMKCKTGIYHSTMDSYMFGGGGIYIDSEGNKTGNGSIIGEAIDGWIRVQRINKSYNKLTKDDICGAPQFNTLELEKYLQTLKEQN